MIYSHTFLRSVITSFSVTVFVLLFSSQVVQAARPSTAPRIVNWNYAWSIDSEKEAKELALWDVLIMDVENAHYSHDRLELIRELNPEIKILAYISLTDIRPDASSLDEGTLRKSIGDALDTHEEWIVHTASGDRAEWWPTYAIMNITDVQKDSSEGELFQDFFVDTIAEQIIKDPAWDGIFFDNLWEGISFVSSDIDLDEDNNADDQETMDAEWQEGVSAILRNTRARAEDADRQDFIITGNGGTLYYEHIDGVGFEHFPDTVYGGWTQSMEEYFFITRHLSRDPYALINTNVQNTQEQENYAAFRYGLASTLLGDGYYSFDSGDETHHERWYYDEYSVMLGEAVSDAYNVNNPEATELAKGVWRRDFENASVLVNSTESEQFIDLKTAYEKIQGTQDTEVNSGEIVGSVQLAAHDGIILLKRFSEVRNATYLNGAYAKVFSMNGLMERNSFFEYNAAYASNTQVHTLKKKTIVADHNAVRVYNKDGSLRTVFFPYGESYTGGIDIAVGRTKKNRVRIITGNNSGVATVRIFNMNGRESRYSGCTPFGQFTGGLDVAVGNKNKKNRLEIVVGAGQGGGPQVRTLNTRCEIIRSGFFAFDASYRTGVHVAMGDVNGDGRDEIVVAPGQGGGPQVRVFSRRGKVLSAGFFVYPKSDTSGVWLSTADIDGDSIDEIITNSYSIFDSF